MTSISKNANQVIACGGAGTNILAEFSKIGVTDLPGFARVIPCYVDTSMSNLRNKQIPDENLYLFEGIDGSGKVRSQNYDDISKKTKEILLKFKPTPINIILHSASGGSGGIIGSVLVSELKARGHQVIVVLIGSTDTRIEIENTIKTLKSYESISEKRDSSVVLHYLENTRLEPRGEINRQARKFIQSLMGLYSGQNDELDTADLKNWLNYTSITGGQPRLASINMAVTTEELNSVGTVVSVATLAMPGMETCIGQTPAYQCVGYPPASWGDKTLENSRVIGDNAMHFCISDDFILDNVTRLNKMLTDVNDVFESRNARKSILDKNDNKTDVGIIL